MKVQYFKEEVTNEVDKEIDCDLEDCLFCGGVNRDWRS